MKTTNASPSSLLDLRRRALDAVPAREQAILNIVDSLTVGPRVRTPSELLSSPMFAYALPALYSAVRSLADETPSRNRKQHRALTRLLKQLRRARGSWLEAWAKPLDLEAERIGTWRLFALDATAAPRPKAPTVRRGFAHSTRGMVPGHTLSVIGQRCGPGAWTLPLEIEVVPVDEHPRLFGPKQVARYAREQGWDPDDLLTVDSDYTNAPSLTPIVEAGINVLGRISGRRVLYLPPPQASARRGRPPKRGHKLKLWDQRTLSTPTLTQVVRLDDGRSLRISQWEDVRMGTWEKQPLSLYRVIEYRADGRVRYERPLWLVYAGRSPAPSPEQAHWCYAARFGLEHTFRFLKGELGLVSGQFSSSGAAGRLSLWVELVATAMWEAFAGRQDLTSGAVSAPRVLAPEHLTPGRVRRMAAAIFLQLGVSKPTPTSRGKSPGRAKGMHFEPRKRYRLFRRRKGKKAA
jgi:hypothetical protein